MAFAAPVPFVGDGNFYEIIIMSEVKKYEELLRSVKSVVSSTHEPAKDSLAVLFHRTNKRRVIRYDETALDMDDVATLSLSCLNIVAVDNICPYFNNLYHLNLSFNRIASLDGCLNSKLLTVLDVSHNKLTSLPIEFNYLDSLRILRVQNNSLVSIDNISSLKGLKELWISNNNHLDWKEYTYLLPLKSLEILIYSPHDGLTDEAKYVEFILLLLPALANINGIYRDTSDNNVKINRFLRSVDGKMLLNKSKNQLNPFQKSIFAVPTFASLLGTSPLTAGPHSSIKIEEKQPDSVGMTHAVRNSPPKSKKHSKPGHRPVVKSFRAVRNPISTTLMSTKEETSNPDQDVNNDVETAETTPDNQNVIITSTPHPMTVIKYNETLDAPIALCINEDGSGYAKWSNGGPISASFESKRLFAQYTNGSIACILDKSGTGSVMNPKGKCLLLLNERGVANVLDEKNGNIITSYDQSTSGDLTDEYNHSWVMGGLHITFVPSTWNLLIKVKTNKYICEFSNKKGVVLLDELPDVKEEVRGRDKQGRVRDIASTEEHLQVRSDLSDLVSNLDDVMSKFMKDPSGNQSKQRGKSKKHGKK